MLKKIAITFIAVCVGMVGLGYVMYLANGAPVAPSMDVTASIGGSRDVAEYRAAIDEALKK